MFEKRMTYGVIGFLRARPGEPPPKIVVEYVNGVPVNKYTGYDKNTYLVLYPKERLAPSAIPLTKKTVSIFQTVREY